MRKNKYIFSRSAFENTRRTINEMNSVCGARNGIITINSILTDNMKSAMSSLGFEYLSSDGEMKHHFKSPRGSEENGMDGEMIQGFMHDRMDPSFTEQGVVDSVNRQLMAPPRRTTLNQNPSMFAGEQPDAFMVNPQDPDQIMKRLRGMR